MTPSKLDTFDEHPSEVELEVHPLITLVVARMESNPKEFYRFDPTRTGCSTNPNTTKVGAQTKQILEGTKALWNRKEKRLYNIALRKVLLGEAHERLMATLLTGN